MDLEKLQLIRDDILKEEYIPKAKSNEFSSLFVHSGCPFTLKENLFTFHAFRRFSDKNYPIYLFITGEDKGELDLLLERIDNIHVAIIPKLKNAFEYNNWMLYSLYSLLPENVENLLTMQNDGSLIKSGWEEYCINFDYLGSNWDKSVNLLQNYYPNINRTYIGNGGFSFRKASKIKEVLKAIKKAGGKNFIHGQTIDDEVAYFGNDFAEDAVLSVLGFGLGIFNPVTVEQARKFSHEPIEFSLYMDKNNTERPMGFHKCNG